MFPNIDHHYLIQTLILHALSQATLLSHLGQSMLPLTIDATSPSSRARRNAALAVIAASACVLLVVCGTWSTEMMSSQDGGVGGGGGAAELESVSAKAGALARVSGVQMVKDVKKVLQDVEATLQARASRKRAGTGRVRPESADVKRNLNDVDHIMDGLEALVHESSSGSSGSPSTGGGISSSSSAGIVGSIPISSGPSSVTVSGSTKVKHRVRGRNAASAALDSMPGGSVKRKGKKKLDAKQLAIAAKMKALTDQISKDFKKVTGYGKQAGYVPPPKIPHV